MLFGNVYIMRFKQILSLLLISSSAFAGIVQTQDTLGSLSQQQYNQLNAKIIVCQKYRSRKVDIKDDWLLKQSIQVRHIVLFELSKNAMNQCIQPEENNYVNTLVALAAAGNSQPLTQYINLKATNLIDERGLKILKNEGVDLKEIDRLALYPKYQLPFEPMQ